MININLERPIVFLDTETTGVDTSKDRIVELSMIKVFIHSTSGVNSDERRTKRFNPGIPIPEGATAVHGITDEDVKYERPFSSYAKGILDFMSGCDLAGFNSNSFDLPILNAEFVRAGIEWDYTQHKLLDVGNMYKQLAPRTLTAAYKDYCGEDHENAHGAEADTLATVRVFFNMLNRHGNDEGFPNTIDDLQLYGNYGRKILDLSGRFTVDTDGDIIFTFGKNINVKAKLELNYLKWMLKSDFAPDTKKICEQVIKQETDGK